jgi:hypothetical protein
MTLRAIALRLLQPVPPGGLEPERVSLVGVADCDAEKRNAAAGRFDDMQAFAETGAMLDAHIPDFAGPLTRERTTSIAVEAALASRALSSHFSQIEAISVDLLLRLRFRLFEARTRQHGLKLGQRSHWQHDYDVGLRSSFESECGIAARIRTHH